MKPYVRIAEFHLGFSSRGGAKVIIAKLDWGGGRTIVILQMLQGIL